MPHTKEYRQTEDGKEEGCGDLERERGGGVRPLRRMGEGAGRRKGREGSYKGSAAPGLGCLEPGLDIPAKDGRGYGRGQSEREGQGCIYCCPPADEVRACPACCLHCFRVLVALNQVCERAGE